MTCCDGGGILRERHYELLTLVFSFSFSFPFYSIFLLTSILFSIVVCVILFYCIVVQCLLFIDVRIYFYCMPLYSILFFSILFFFLFHSFFLFSSILFYSILLCTVGVPLGLYCIVWLVFYSGTQVFYSIASPL